MQESQSYEKMINGRYQLIKELGRGGMGVVHLANDRLTGETVALKQVLTPVINLMFASMPNLNTNDELRLALAHEFQTLASLRHPHIISVLDYGFDEKKLPYFSMTYLDDAQTLVEAAKQAATAQKVQYILELLQALAYLHRRGILHRDIKPENVLVSDNTVRVLDFGLAAAKEKAQESVGSWLYMAPEVLLERPATEAADLYAVGVLAFYLFANRHPFDIYAADLLEDILETSPDLTLLGGIDEGLTAVIAKLLAKAPENRYQNAEETIAAFNAALGKPIPRETQAIRESYLQAATFVGRDAELETLLAAMQQAKEGAGTAWLVSGESGVGKSRLLDELRIRALVEGALVLRGQAVEEAGQSYQLWRDAVQRLVLTSEPDDLATSVLKTIVPNIDTLLNREVVPAPELSGQAGRQRLISTITQLFQQQQQWILLLLEDLHWSRDSLDVLQQLTRLAVGLPLLIIGSYRDDEANLQQVLPHMQHMHLERLSSENMSQLSSAMLGEAGEQPEVLALLQRETEGNAFFLVEVVRALAIEAGRLSAIGQMVLPEKLFPEGIQTIVARRLSRLPEAAQPLLPGVAVMGRQLDLLLVQGLIKKLALDVDLEAWLSLCSDAAVLGIENGRWRFAHDKIREGIVADFASADHMHWHRQAAETIEAVYPDEPAQASSLAYHWHEVGNRIKEWRYAQVAGEYAQRQFLNKEAITHLSRALELTSEDNFGHQYDLLRQREQIYHLQGEREIQQQDLDRMAALADQLRQSATIDRRAEVSLRVAAYAEATADYPAAIDAANRALELATEVEQRAASHLALGRSLMRQGNYDEAREQFGLSLTAAQANQLLQIEADSYRFHGSIAADLSRFEEAKTYYQQALPIYRQIRDRQGESIILNNSGVAAYSQGNVTEGLVFWEQAEQILDQIGDRESRARLLTNLSSIYIDLGDYETGRSYCQTALQICREIDTRFGVCLNLINLGLVAHYQYDFVQADEFSLEALETAKEIGSTFLQGIALKDRAYILANQERLEEAAALYQQAIAIWVELEQQSQLLETKAGLAQVALRNGDLMQAGELIEPVAAYAQANKTLDGMSRPFHVYLVCYEVLLARHEASQAITILQKAASQLQLQSSRITDEQLRQSFQEKVVTNRKIAAYALQV